MKCINSVIFILISITFPGFLFPQEYPAENESPDLTAEAIKSAEQNVEKIYSDKLKERKPEQIKQTISEFLTEGDNTENKAATRYVLLCKAADLSACIGEVEYAVTALNKLEGLTDKSQTERKTAVLGTLSKTARDQQKCKQLAEAYLSLCCSFEESCKYDAAGKAAAAGYKAAARARDNDLKAVFINKRKTLSAAEKEYKAVLKALEKLSENPEDPKANLAAGSYYCFTKGDWDKGLPYLTRGSDEKLKQAAAQDVRLSKLGDDDLGWEQGSLEKLGTMWFDYAGKNRNTLVQGMCGARAVLWYTKALGMIEGINRKPIEEKLAQAEKFAENAPNLMGSIPVGAVSIVTFSDDSLIDKNGKTCISDLAYKGVLYPIVSGKLCTGKAGKGIEVPAGEEGTTFNYSKESFSISPPYSVSIWVNFASFKPQSFIKFLGGPGISIYTSPDGKFRFVHGVRCDSYGGDSGTVKTDTWYHLVVTVNGREGDKVKEENITYYINGKKARTNLAHAEGELQPIVLNQIRFGEDEFHGMIDEFGVWGRVLSEKEAEQLYSLGKAGKPLK